MEWNECFEVYIWISLLPLVRWKIGFLWSCIYVFSCFFSFHPFSCMFLALRTCETGKWQIEVESEGQRHEQCVGLRLKKNQWCVKAYCLISLRCGLRGLRRQRSREESSVTVSEIKHLTAPPRSNIWPLSMWKSTLHCRKPSDNQGPAVF